MDIGSKVIITREGPYKGTEGVISGRCAGGYSPFIVDATRFLFWGEDRTDGRLRSLTMFPSEMEIVAAKAA